MAKATGADGEPCLGFHTGPLGSEAVSLEGSTDIGNLVWE
jgi:hypothetical protein